MVTHTAQYPNALRAFIKQAGYSFREVSRETTIPESTLYDWAAGNRVIPHKERRLLADLLGCSVEALAPRSKIWRRAARIYKLALRPLQNLVMSCG